jgi:hypothetical protein
LVLAGYIILLLHVSLSLTGQLTAGRTAGSLSVGCAMQCDTCCYSVLLEMVFSTTCNNLLAAVVAVSYADADACRAAAAAACTGGLVRAACTWHAIAVQGTRAVAFSSIMYTIYEHGRRDHCFCYSATCFDRPAVWLWLERVNSVHVLLLLLQVHGPHYLSDRGKIAAGHYCTSAAASHQMGYLCPQIDVLLLLQVRGPQYLADRGKVAAGHRAYCLLAVDLVTTPTAVQHVARFLPSVR